LDKHVYIIKKNTGVLLLEVGLVAYFEKAKRMYISGKQNKEQNDEIILGNIL
jgi:hypothetical protein